MFVAISHSAHPYFAPSPWIRGQLVALSEPAVALGESGKRGRPAHFLIVLVDLLESRVIKSRDLERCLTENTFDPVPTFR